MANARIAQETESNGGSRIMSDELDRLESAFKLQKPGQPREAARKAAIQNAMAQFDAENQQVKENLKISQGNGFGVRLKERGNKLLNILLRRNPMNLVHMNFKHILAGGASFAVLALVVTNINVIMPGGPLIIDDLDKPVTGVPKNNEPIDIEIRADVSEPQTPIGEKRQVNIDARNEKDWVANKNASERAKIPKNDAQSLEKKELNDAVVAAEEVVREAESDAAASVAVSRPKPTVASKKGKRRQSGFAVGGLAASQGVVSMPSSMAQAQPTLRKQVGDVLTQHYQEQGRDKFSNVAPNPTKLVSEDPLSTFSVDVDTASYTFIRSALNRGVLPQKNAVRIEEMINYFSYNYKPPTDRAQPFSANVSIMQTPWNVNTKLMRIGVKGFELPKSEAPHANLVFLIDTSGSMNAPNKLPLLRNSFKLLLQSLKPDDTISIVTYAGSAGVVLSPTKIADKNKILAALNNLRSGGSTAGAEGIRQAYQLAEQNLDKKGVNRVILATDGDFNVGIRNPEELKSYVERKRKTGVTLSILGFGHGNYNDELMQTLAQNGNGNAAYIDTLSEARKVLVEEAGSTLFTIAKDVKLQVEFNPAMVGEYRLIGYETRQLKREDFNNDKVDAGDIGAGHSVTALYEITAKGVSGQLVDELRYKTKSVDDGVDKRVADSENANEYAFVKIRYKQPKSDTSQLITIPVTRSNEIAEDGTAPREAKFAAAVAAFGQLLKGGQYTGKYSYDDVVALAQSAKGDDRFGYRAEFINLVRLAKSAAVLEPQK